jgi:hypothetical protein
VCYYLKTSNESENAEIVQLSAVCGNSHFTKFVLPKGGIHVKGTAVNGLEIRTIKGNNIIFNIIRKLNPAIYKRHCLNLWLNALGEGKVILAAHNGNVFDMKFVLKFVTDI